VPDIASAIQRNFRDRHARRKAPSSVAV
jgi:hypothetical protein